MSAVFSAEYARELVQRARDGATYVANCFALDCEHDGPDGLCRDESAPDTHHFWRPRAAIIANHASGDYWPEYDHHNAHWVEWYRFVATHQVLANHVYTRDRDNTLGGWPDAAVALATMQSNFIACASALGRLCQLPPEWSAEIRTEARRIGEQKGGA